MTHGLKCWDSAGRLTFDINIRTVRSTTVLTVPSGSSGSILLSSLPSGLDGIRFTPTNPAAYNVAPFTSADNSRIYWSGGVGDHRLTVVDISGLGGNTQFDGGT